MNEEQLAAIAEFRTWLNERGDEQTTEALLIQLVTGIKTQREAVLLEPLSATFELDIQVNAAANALTPRGLPNAFLNQVNDLFQTGLGGFRSEVLIGLGILEFNPENILVFRLTREGRARILKIASLLN